VAEDERNEQPNDTQAEAPAEETGAEPEAAAEAVAVPAEEQVAPEADAAPAGDESVAGDVAAEAPVEEDSSPGPQEPAEGEEPAEAEPAEAEDGGAAAAAEPAAAAAAPAGAPARKKRKRLPRSERRRRPKVKRERPTGHATRPRVPRPPKPERLIGRRQVRRGVVVSSAMDKTIVVRVETVKAHPKYKKVVRRSRKLHAHDEQNAASVGDTVRIVESRPLSKTKTWRLAEVLERAK
jgi:small subunit ribosomal protein S17